ncbi:MAG: translation initiation factor [Tannerellaceae bacterium]|nr:translation initiation factor [Tannerellaceae bacterium]
MKSEGRKNREGVVYSTNPDFSVMNDDDKEESRSLENREQALRVSADKRNRKGKIVTLISGFSGPGHELDALARLLKLKCGVGGSTKDGEIILQGDFRDKVIEILHREGYSKSKRI